MTGRDKEDVIKDIDEMSDCIKGVVSEQLKIARHRVVCIHNFSTQSAPIGTKYPGCYYLQNSMKQMSYINAAAFDPNWERSNGCKIEKFTADIYNIPQIFLTYDSSGYHFPDENICKEIFNK